MPFIIDSRIQRKVWLYQEITPYETRISSALNKVGGNETPTHMSIGSLTLREMVFKHTYTKICGLFGLLPLRWSDCDYTDV